MSALCVSDLYNTPEPRRVTPLALHAHTPLHPTIILLSLTSTRKPLYCQLNLVKSHQSKEPLDTADILPQT